MQSQAHSIIFPPSQENSQCLGMQTYKSLTVFGCGLVYLAALGVNAVTTERKSGRGAGRGAAKVARGRVRRVELTGGEAAAEMRS